MFEMHSTDKRRQEEVLKVEVREKTGRERGARREELLLVLQERLNGEELHQSAEGSVQAAVNMCKCREKRDERQRVCFYREE